MPVEATKDRLKTVLEYEAQLNRREFLELSSRPDPVVRGLQAEAERSKEPFGALHPELVADKLIAAVRIELRNRRKLAEMIPELASVIFEAEFVAGIESRICAAADLIRKQIDDRHWFSRAPECRRAPDVLAAHQALVDAQRRGEQVDYARLFQERQPPDYSPLQRFRFRAAAAVLNARIEFGLMRLRASLGTPDPGERAVFHHAAAMLLASIHDISAAADSLRQQGGDAPALAVQAFAAALVGARDIPAPARLELARLAQALVRAALAPRGARDLPTVARLFADINTAATGQPEVAEVWRHCSPEVVRYFAAP